MRKSPAMWRYAPRERRLKVIFRNFLRATELKKIRKGNIPKGVFRGVKYGEI